MDMWPIGSQSATQRWVQNPILLDDEGRKLRRITTKRAFTVRVPWMFAFGNVVGHLADAGATSETGHGQGLERIQRCCDFVAFCSTV